MKKCIILGMVCLSILSACQQNNVVTLSGTVSGKADQPVLIKDYKITEQIDTLKIADGKFQKTFTVNAPEFRYFSFGDHRKELFLAPGYKLVMNFIGEKFDSTFRFEGKGAIENSILDSLNKKERYNMGSVFTLPAKASLNYVDSICITHKNYLRKLVKSMKSDEVFEEYAGKMLESEAAFVKTFLGLQRKDNDSAYFSYLDSINFEEGKYLNIPMYRNLLRFSISVKTKKFITRMDSASRNTPEAYQQALFTVLDKIRNKDIKEYLTFLLIHDNLRNGNVQNFDIMKVYFEKNVTDSTYIKEFQTTYQLKILLAPGKPAFEFTCSNAEGNPVSLKDLRGKLVYIDFWATWCGPCLQETPHFIKLMRDYKGKDIVFVSISIDNDKNKWLKVVLEEKPEYISLIADRGWNSKVIKAYQINIIPAFILIDKEGKLITREAPWPSSPDIRKTLDEYMGTIVMKK
jgi:thiol-disulfide isomerase/thioredoxin